MKILALDLGKFKTMCCFFDTETRKHEFLNAATDRNYLTTVFQKHKIDLVVMEACGPSGWINDLAVSLGPKQSDFVYSNGLSADPHSAFETVRPRSSQWKQKPISEAYQTIGSSQTTSSHRKSHRWARILLMG